MALGKDEIVNLYQQRAKRYSFASQPCYLEGFREWAYRKKAVEALALKCDDTVGALCCRTDLIFMLLEESVGAAGKVIRVVMTGSKLYVAGETVRKNGSSNVELGHSDAASFEFSRRVDGVISTFALTLISEYESVTRAGSETLASGGRFVILDFKMPNCWLSRLGPVDCLASRPFGATPELTTCRHWETLNCSRAEGAMED